MNNRRVILFLMNEKGLKVLPAVKQFLSKFNFLVVIGSDSAVANDYSNEILSYCIDEGIPYKFRIDYDHNFYLNFDYAIAIGWRWLIHGFDGKLLVFHDSILPKYRGFNPLVTALLNEDKVIGVTALLATEEFDEGNIVAQLTEIISYPIKIKCAIEKVAELYYKLLLDCLHILWGGELHSEPQDHSKATYSVWRDEEDYHIDWNKKPDDVKRFIDAVGFPYLNAFSLVDGNIVRISDVEVVQYFHVENRVNGKVMFIDSNGCPTVLCGDGALKIKSACIQRENELQDFLPLSRFRIRFK